MQIEKPLTYYIPDTRGVVQSRYGRGNLKVGLEVFTFSRLPGRPHKTALGSIDGRPTQTIAADDPDAPAYQHWQGTCPGSTPECERICYAARPVTELGPVASMWLRNSTTDEVPTIPEEAEYLRLHVSGDFSTNRYINNWTWQIVQRPDVKVWGYTRSWRVPSLLESLEELRALPNVQLFASVDKSTPDAEVEMITAAGWRRAWIDGDARAGEVCSAVAHSALAALFEDFELQRTGDGVKTLICPEETKAVANCVACGFCITGQRNDVTFLQH